jgi:hypothetical protein
MSTPGTSLYVNADWSALVPVNSPEAAFGLTVEEAKRRGLLPAEGETFAPAETIGSANAEPEADTPAEPEPEEKQAPKPANKAARKSANK